MLVKSALWQCNILFTFVLMTLSSSTAERTSLERHFLFSASFFHPGRSTRLTSSPVSMSYLVSDKHVSPYLRCAHLSLSQISTSHLVSGKHISPCLGEHTSHLVSVKHVSPYLRCAHLSLSQSQRWCILGQGWTLQFLGSKGQRSRSACLKVEACRAQHALSCNF